MKKKNIYISVAVVAVIGLTAGLLVANTKSLKGMVQFDPSFNSGTVTSIDNTATTNNTGSLSAKEAADAVAKQMGLAETAKTQAVNAKNSAALSAKANNKSETAKYVQEAKNAATTATNASVSATKSANLVEDAAQNDYDTWQNLKKDVEAKDLEYSNEFAVKEKLNAILDQIVKVNAAITSTNDAYSSLKDCDLKITNQCFNREQTYDGKKNDKAYEWATLNDLIKTAGITTQAEKAETDVVNNAGGTAVTDPAGLTETLKLQGLRVLVEGLKADSVSKLATIDANRATVIKSRNAAKATYDASVILANQANANALSAKTFSIDANTAAQEAEQIYADTFSGTVTPPADNTTTTKTPLLVVKGGARSTLKVDWGNTTNQVVLGEWTISATEPLLISGARYTIGLPEAEIDNSYNRVTDYFDNLKVIAKVTGTTTSTKMNWNDNLNINGKNNLTLTLTGTPAQRAKTDFVAQALEGKQVAVIFQTLTDKTGKKYSVDRPAQQWAFDYEQAGVNPARNATYGGIVLKSATTSTTPTKPGDVAPTTSGLLKVETAGTGKLVLVWNDTNMKELGKWNVYPAKDISISDLMFTIGTSGKNNVASDYFKNMALVVDGKGVQKKQFAITDKITLDGGTPYSISLVGQTRPKSESDFTTNNLNKNQIAMVVKTITTSDGKVYSTQSSITSNSRGGTIDPNLNVLSAEVFQNTILGGINLVSAGVSAPAGDDDEPTVTPSAADDEPIDTPPAADDEPIDTPPATDDNTTTANDVVELGNALTKANYACTDSFGDTQGHYAENTICRLYRANIVKGKTSDRFDPNGQVTRAEFLKMLVKTFGHDESEASGKTESYKDVAPSDWYYSYVVIGENLNILRNQGGNFNPNANITRGEASVLLARIAGKTLYGYTQSDIQFKDVNVNDFFAYAVILASQTNVNMPDGSTTTIVKGYTNGNFGSTDNITRADSALILHRAYIGWAI